MPPVKIFGGKPVALDTTCPMELMVNGFPGEEDGPPDDENPGATPERTVPEPPDLHAHGFE